MATFSSPKKIHDIVTDEKSPRNSVWKDVKSDNEDAKDVKPKLSFDETSVAQKICVPGPNVAFTPKLLPFAEYLAAINKEGSLGCGPKKFPKYENGKYCCVDERVSNQEQLDYVNMLLESAIRNVGDTAFSKNKKGFLFLIRTRDYLLNIDKTLADNLELPEPYTNIIDWYTATEKRVAQEISSYRPNPEPEIKMGGRKKSRKSRKGRKKKTTKQKKNNNKKSRKTRK